MSYVGSKNFYKRLKPFLSTKQSYYGGSKIVLKENDSIVSDASKVAEISICIINLSLKIVGFQWYLVYMLFGSWMGLNIGIISH